MNFQSSSVSAPIRVLVVNPLCTAAQMAIVKIMSGLVFGTDQLVDLILLVYSNERSAAQDLKLELHTCAFSCMNAVEVSSDLPLISDADVFCFITNFRNPNSVDFNEIDNDQFDVLYMIIKIATSLSKPVPTLEVLDKNSKKRSFVEDKTPLKPIIMADGIVTLNILYNLTNIPSDVFFCPSPLPSLAKSVLGDHLKDKSSIINNVFVWGANDEVFHIEVEKPMVRYDRIDKETECDWDIMGKTVQGSFGLDHSQFNESWLKKDFIEKVLVSASKNPYGSIYRASEFSKTLHSVWKSRSTSADFKAYASVGVISDGSLRTVKGLAYILPLVFSGGAWSVNKRFEETSHLQQEIKRINKAAEKLNKKLIPYCKRFLEENIIKQAFISSSNSDLAQSSSTYSSGSGSAHVILQLGKGRGQH